MTDIPENAICIVDGLHGIYIPEIFAHRFRDSCRVHPADAMRTILKGPAADHYWDAWDEILDGTVLTIDGQTGRLEHDGDLFFIPDPMFPHGFDRYVGTCDSIETEVDGVRYVARIEPDYFTHIDDDDIHATDRNVTGCTPAQHEKLMKARESWFSDEWFYCGIVIDAYRGEWCREGVCSLFGIEANYPESDNEYLHDVANDLLNEAIAEIKEEN